MNRVFIYIFLALFPIIGTHNALLPVSGSETILFLACLSLALLVLNLKNITISNDAMAYISPTSWALLGFYFWASCGYFYTIDADNGFLIVNQYLGAACLYLALILFSRNEIEVIRMLWILLICAGFLSVFAIAQQFGFPDFNMVSSTPSYSSSLFTNKNFLGTYILIMIPLACLLYSGSPGIKAK